jgi:hypothetical protein
MSYDATIKSGDTRHALKAILKDISGNPVDLTDCRVEFRMAVPGQPAVIDRVAHVQDVTAGEVWVVWAPGETDKSGIYRAEFQVTYSDGRKETFPNNGYLSIQILSSLSKE